MSDDGTLTVPGMWHLKLPQALRPLRAQARAVLPLPAAADLSAWREHLGRLVTLQVPGT